jgi:hypothetical protein
LCILGQQLQADIDIASEQLQVIVPSFTDTVDFIPSEILWICLVDPTHDAVIIKAIDKEPDASSGMEMDYLHIVVDVKLNIIKHLTAQIRRLSILDSGGTTAASQFEKSELTGLRPQLAQCLRLCSYLSLRLPRLRESDENAVSVFLCGVLYTWFRLLTYVDQV